MDSPGSKILGVGIRQFKNHGKKERQAQGRRPDLWKCYKVGRGGWGPAQEAEEAEGQYGGLASVLRSMGSLVLRRAEIPSKQWLG